MDHPEKDGRNRPDMPSESPLVSLMKVGKTIDAFFAPFQQAQEACEKLQHGRVLGPAERRARHENERLKRQLDQELARPYIEETSRLKSELQDPQHSGYQQSGLQASVQPQRKQIIYFPQARYVAFGNKLVLSSRQRNAWALFEALAEGDSIHIARLKEHIWQGRQTPEQWERAVHEAAVALRQAFNSVEVGLGNQLLPVAKNSVYRFDLANIIITPNEHVDGFRPSP